MRKWFVFVVMSGVLGSVVSGCAVDTTEDSQTSQYGFTRDSTGQVKQTDTASLGDFTPAQSFEHSLASEPAATAIDPRSVACSGACDADVCVCTGDLDCCIIGCTLCWELVD
jgi:hypothetical protein